MGAQEKAAGVLDTAATADTTRGDSASLAKRAANFRAREMNPIDRVLPLLSKVRRRQPGQWSACCPAHEDWRPSLSVRETPDGAVLIHCFAGCDVADVVGALGLELHELFPPKDKPTNSPSRTARLLTPGQALELLHDEAQIIAVCGANIAHGVVLSHDDRERALLAAGRIAYIRAGVMA
jgi:hypothetical protein